MGDAVVVKSGKLQLQVKSFMRTQWVDKFCIVYGRSASSHPYMDFYDSKDAFESYKKSGKKCDKTIDLQHLKVVKHSSQKTSQGQENVIEIHVRRNKHFLMVKNHADSQDWSVKLNSFVSETEGDVSSSGVTNDPDPDYSDDDECELSTVNQMYESSDSAARFEVEVKEGDLATLCGIVGKKTLLVSQAELAFEDPGTRRILYTFSFNWLRRYGKQAVDVFNFEVGRKCNNGPGSVEFISTASKDIHHLISKNSKNTSTTVTPQPRKHALEPQPVDMSGIGGPSMVTNVGRRHPGKQNVPVLVPLPGPKPERNSNTPTTPTAVEVNLRDSHKENLESEHVTDKFKKKLETKLHDDISKKDSVKEGSKKDKKEKEKKEKEMEKEKKTKEKEEKKSMFGGLFSSKKDKGKEKEHDKVEKDQEPNSKWHAPPGVNLYEEPDLILPPTKPLKISEALYDVADVQVEPKKNPAGYACNSEALYDEAMSVSRDPPSSSGPVEYAQPMTRNTTSAKDVYSDARDVDKSGNAWRQFARKEEEEHHMENYTSIKSARGEVKKSPPPIPKKTYDDDEVDDTYDRTTNVVSSRYTKHNENLYGTASGSVGNVVSVPMTNKGSDSEGEDLYDNPEDEGYETTGTKHRRRVVEAYEEADVTPAFQKQKSSKSYPGNETLYEEIG